MDRVHFHGEVLLRVGNVALPPLAGEKPDYIKFHHKCTIFICGTQIINCIHLEGQRTVHNQNAVCSSLVRQLVGPFARIALLLRMLSEERKMQSKASVLGKNVSSEAPGLLDILLFQLR